VELDHGYSVYTIFAVEKESGGVVGEGGRKERRFREVPKICIQAGKLRIEREDRLNELWEHSEEEKKRGGKVISFFRGGADMLWLLESLPRECAVHRKKFGNGGSGESKGVEGGADAFGKLWGDNLRG